VCGSPLLLVLAVDLPRMTVDFLRRLVAHATALTGVVPELKGALEPLAAIYPKRCHALACEALARSSHAARDFAEACRREGTVRSVPVSADDAACFVNWNRPSDLSASEGVSPGKQEFLVSKPSADPKIPKFRD
jgi:molybdopterin-guanine dinucleotide biosynthesis protein A